MRQTPPSGRSVARRVGSSCDVFLRSRSSALDAVMALAASPLSDDLALGITEDRFSTRLSLGAVVGRSLPCEEVPLYRLAQGIEIVRKGARKYPYGYSSRRL